jgi:D-glucosaminate-6-phosphate ammonia-lyase
MPDQVVEAMQQVSLHSVSIEELQNAVGKKIAAMLGCEAALITAGCASSLALATAACIAGKDQSAIVRLPDTTGMKSEVIMQKSHRFEYDHAIRNAGAKIVEIETIEELQAAISSRTAMLFFLNSANTLGKIQREEFAQLANRVAIPALVDAAADLPPVENLYVLTRMGFDLVGFSGGKSLRGPQCSGLLIGRNSLIQAAFLNGSPHSDSLGRTSKVGKEEIVGLYRALQIFLQTDHTAEWRGWEQRVSLIADELSKIQGVRPTLTIPPVPHNRPQVNIQWDQQRIALTPKDVVAMLRSGNPRIELAPGSDESTNGVNVAVWMLRPHEDEIVARRMSEIFEEGRRKGVRASN